LKFSELNLTDELLSGLKDINFIEPTPIQERAIPPILEGKDIIGTAQTGTGKTGAFIIPIMDRILRASNRSGIKAIILTPTRELAQQIDEQIFAIGYHTGITSATVIGGSDFSAQAKALKAGVDIVVATPGRFIDQNKIVNIDFSTVEYLVLDEADRMLDMGFLPDMKKIINWIPEGRQSLLFSATMPKEIEKLASTMMKENPVSVEVARSRPSQLVEQRAYLLKSDQKIPLVKKIFDTIKWDSCIIFTSTKKGTDELQRLLKRQGIKAGSIHGDRSQDERNKALNAFKNGQIPVIVATNVIARGIDIKDVSMIINYDVPRSSDDYVHRIGRTGRYDKSGIAVTLITRRDSRAFSEIDRIKDNKIKKIELPDSFDEKTNFYWEKKDEPVPDNDSRKDSPVQAKKPDGGNKEKSQDKTPSEKKKSRGKGSGRGKKSGKNTNKIPEKESKKGGKSVDRSESLTKGDEASKSAAKAKGNGGKATAGRPGEDQTNKPEESLKKAEVIAPLRVQKATERNRYSRKPSKGVWGIIKSIIPKFKRDQH